ncbi:hypothetical protein SSBR45G_00030 [Bradyrhizobium sp. SSBR45G]|uniref:hypothetical protein n=1 Tax=unclassified Bradyrhizobium TaxID=2631580 RepID=UPI0023428EDB|nr:MULTISPECIES: hypothetical protein [unclassified Bradyrhizobium]GLH75095.1 hypothetical protein SSBR45G_00030 [Bradyrhizobium sp. SSBR45G]GLH83118.1 hypothetical protein SSBR45R_05780 [Bradyrhizobium sp. SSBR45R]
MDIRKDEAGLKTGRAMPYLVRIAILLSIIILATYAVMRYPAVDTEFAKARAAASESTGVLVPASCANVVKLGSIPDGGVCWIGLSKYRTAQPYFKDMTDEKLLREAYLDTGRKIEPISPWLTLIATVLTGLAGPTILIGTSLVVIGLSPAARQAGSLMALYRATHPGRLARSLLTIWAVLAAMLLAYKLYGHIRAYLTMADVIRERGIPLKDIASDAGWEVAMVLAFAFILLLAGLIIYWAAKLTAWTISGLMRLKRQGSRPALADRDAQA